MGVSKWHLTVVAVICVGLVASCASHEGSPKVTPTTEQSHQGTLDLHGVDWNDVAVPGRSCLHANDIRLHHGHALLRDNTKGHPIKPGSNGVRYDQLVLNGPVVYGDFEGDAHGDAAVPLDCNNNGGTADGDILNSVAVYSGRTGKLHYLGLITAQHQRRNVLPTLLSIRSVARGALTVQESWYGSDDMTCCPKGKATTRWTMSAGKVVPVEARVTASPN